MKFRKSLGIIPALVAVTAMLVGPTSIASANEPQIRIVGGDKTMAIEQVAESDIAALSRDLKLTEDEVKKQYAGQNQFGAALLAIHNLPASGFFSAQWGNTDGASAWISFKGDPSGEALEVLEALPFLVQVRNNAAATEVELQTLLEAATKETAARPGVASVDSYFDHVTGAITINYSVKDGQAVEEFTGSSLASTSKAPVSVTVNRVKSAGYVEQALIAGVLLTRSGVGECTSGFTVTKLSTRGILTAGHCRNTLAYSGSTFSLTAQTSHQGSYGDFRYLSTLDTITNKVRYHSAGYTTAVTNLAIAANGNSVCVYGAVTQSLNCASVSSTSSCATNSAGISICQLVKLNSNVTTGGDSGAPWRFGATAYGVHNGICAAVSCYSRVDNAQSLLSVTLKLTP